MEDCLSPIKSDAGNDLQLTSCSNVSCLLTSFDYIVDNIDSADNFPFKILTGIVTLAILVLSIGPMGGLWHYERFGGDPQKRTILNQLIGVLALNSLVASLICQVALLHRLIHGPLSVSMAILVFFAPNFISSIVLLMILNEIILIRFLSAFWWKQLPPLNDDFVGVFLNFVNYGLATMLAIMAQMGGDPNDNLLFIMTGNMHPVTDISMTK